MKEKLSGYYRPTKQEFTELWENGVFVLDASVLLNLYRYSLETRDDFLQILRHISERLWVPYQAAYEYQKNRLNVIARQAEAYGEIEDLLRKTKNRLENDLKSYGRHPLINVSAVANRIQKVFAKVVKELERQKEGHPDFLERDTIRDEVTSILRGKIGSPYDDGKLAETFSEGAERYDKHVPPGYLDADKPEQREKYGDVIIWFQIIDKAKEAKKPIVFVTDDTKEDWWWKFQGRTIGTRPELIEEIKAKAEVPFYMYRSDQFMDYAREYLNQKIDQKAIDEIKEVGEDKERELAKLETLSLRLDSLMEEQAELEQRVKAYEEEQSQLAKGLEDMHFLRGELLHKSGQARLEKWHSEFAEKMSRYEEVEAARDETRRQHDHVIREIKRILNLRRHGLSGGSHSVKLRDAL